MIPFLQQLFLPDINTLQLFSLTSLPYFVLAIALLFVGKLLRDFSTSYSLEKVLTQDDNKAIGISFSGYFLAMGIIYAGVAGSPSSNEIDGETSLLIDLAETAFWSLLGVLLLNLSAILNNHFILPAFSNQKEMLEDKNIGVGAVQAAGYVSSAMVITAIVASPSETSNIFSELALVVVYYLAAHAGLALFALFYRKTSSYNVDLLMEADNSAVGISLSMHLFAIGLVLSHALSISNSLFYFFAALVNSSVFILFIRLLFDRILFRRPNIAREIAKDDNWAIALCQGCVAIGSALLLNSVF